MNRSDLIKSLQQQLGDVLANNLFGQSLDRSQIEYKINQYLQTSLPIGVYGKVKNICTSNESMSVEADIQLPSLNPFQGAPFLMANYLFQEEYTHTENVVITATISIG